MGTQGSPHVLQAGSPFREPLIKFLTRHPSQTVELFMMEATLNDPQWSRMFMVRAELLSQVFGQRKCSGPGVTLGGVCCRGCKIIK